MTRHIHSAQNGFSLIELLLVLSIIVVIAAIWVSRSFTGGEAGGAELLLGTVNSRLAERRGDAARLGAMKTFRETTDETGGGSTNALRNPPVAIDFNQSNTTSSLVTDSRDADYDGRDDSTGLEYTRLRISRNRLGGTLQYVWRYAYRENPLMLPDGWRLASSRDLPVPLIAGGAHGKGELVTRIAFDASGRAYGFYRDVWRNDSPNADSSDVGDAPFWVFYFYMPDQTPAAACAVAVHPSGLIENFRWDGTDWRGFGNRLPSAPSPASSPSPSGTGSPG